MTKKTYGEKLKDPRWQKKRLEILARDEWQCQWCYREDITLHVHHLQYGQCEPWDVPERWLISLCEECHKEEHEHRESGEQFIIDSLKYAGFNSRDLKDIANGFIQMEKFHLHEVMASIIKWALSHAEVMDALTAAYFEEIRNKRKEKEGFLPSSNLVAKTD